jgi:hypothetical protein
MAQEFNSVQMHVSGFNTHYDILLSAGAKAEEHSDETTSRRVQKLSMINCFIYNE